MRSSRSVFFLFVVLAAVLLIFAEQTARASVRGLVEDVNGNNQALIVGVAHGLPGIDIDTSNVERISKDVNYKFSPTVLSNKQGDTKNITDNLTSLAEKAGTKGTLFFYFSGHGSRGSIYAQDRNLKIKEIREAVEKGRETAGPLARLVMMFDSCFSGSLLNPLRSVLPFLRIDEESESLTFADTVVNEMANTRDTTYWNKLFVFAASRANETSNAGGSGSTFTLALTKAFDEVMADDGTIGDFVKKTKKYTRGHHPVERLVPATLESEKMKP